MSIEAMRSQRLNKTQREQLGYRLRRYLSGATDAELTQRLADISANLYTFTSDGRVGLLMSEVRDYWLDRIEHLLVENQTRGRDTLKGHDGSKFVFTKSNLEKFRGQKAILSYVPPANSFFRFGEKKYMEELRDVGGILLKPASTYADRAHDPARRDDEICFRTHVCPHDYDLGVIDPYIRKFLPNRSYQYIDQHKPFDYYLFCVSVRFEIRLFADFCADACLVITNQKAFEERLTTAIRKLLPEYFVKFDLTKYVDPYNMPRTLPFNDPEYAFIKHHAYMYQSEFRLIAAKPARHATIRPLKIEIGSLRDISELVTLEGSPFASVSPPAP